MENFGVLVKIEVVFLGILLENICQLYYEMLNFIIKMNLFYELLKDVDLIKVLCFVELWFMVD